MGNQSYGDTPVPFGSLQNVPIHL